MADGMEKVPGKVPEGADEVTHKGVRLRTQAAGLRVNLEWVEELLAAGARQEDVVAALAERGVRVASVRQFRTMLWRERKRARTKGDAGAPAAATAQAPAERLAGEEGAPVEPPAPRPEAAPDKVRAFAELLDPKKRAEEADKYVLKRRPVIGRK